MLVHTVPVYMWATFKVSFCISASVYKRQVFTITRYYPSGGKWREVSLLCCGLTEEVTYVQYLCTCGVLWGIFFVV